MKELSLKARVFILAVIAGGIAAIGLQVAYIGGSMDAKDIALLAVATALAALAHFRSVQGSTARSSYDLALVVYGFILVVQGPRAAIIASLFACLLDWVWHKRRWYIQVFNICSLAIALNAAGTVYHWAVSGTQPMGLTGAAGVLGAVLVFVVLNHAMVGVVLALASGENLVESGIFGGLTLAIDAALAAAGAAAAVIWFINPYVCVIALAPVYLISTTLRVPDLERQAVTDPKTGVFNTRHFQELLANELTRANRFDRPLTVVMGDLDLLRNINNVYGHLAGDQVLIRVAQIIKSSVRDYDVVARFGGEEFTILMTETSLDQAAPRIEALRAAIAAADIEVSTSIEPIKTTMSFGVAERVSADESPDEIVHRADLAVYRAKLEGRNCVKVAKLDEGESPTHGAAWEAPRSGEDDEQMALLMPVPAAETRIDRPKAGPPNGNAGPSVESDSTVSAGVREARVPRPRRPSPWPSRLLITGVGLAAVAVLTMTLATEAWIPINWVGLGALAAIAVMTEALAVEIYVRETSVSTSAAALVAGAIFFGPIGALVLGAAIAAAAMMKHHSSYSRFVFNGSSQLLAGLGCVWIVRLVGRPPVGQPPWLLFSVCLVSALAVYAVTTGLVAAAMSLGSNEGVSRTWTRHFSWLAPYYLGLGALASCLVFGYVYAGVVGFVSLIVPLLVLRFGQKQYIDHTAAMVGRLRAANVDLKESAEEISTLNDELLTLLAGTLDLRDPYVLGHSRHVARYAASIGKELKLSAGRLELLRKAALLHDIGKLAIPDAILAKNGPLTELEYEEVKEHPMVDARIFVESRYLQDLLPIIRHHHERWDGCGYPSGLKGESIPLEARILSVADAVEAMASDRAYRPGSPVEIVLYEVRANAGGQFDPAVADALCRAVERGSCSIVNSTDEVLGRRSDYQVENSKKRQGAPAVRVAN
ncbi:MAG: diguanylate cyclase [bacterium]